MAPPESAPASVPSLAQPDAEALKQTDGADTSMEEEAQTAGAAEAQIAEGTTAMVFEPAKFAATDSPSGSQNAVREISEEAGATAPASGSTTTDAARVQAIAERIKNLQRRRPDARTRWVAHCDACFKGTKDPGRHPLVSLAEFALDEALALDNDADDADEEDSEFFTDWLRGYRASR